MDRANAEFYEKSRKRLLEKAQERFDRVGTTTMCSSPAGGAVGSLFGYCASGTAAGVGAGFGVGCAVCGLMGCFTHNSRLREAFEKNDKEKGIFDEDFARHTGGGNPTTENPLRGATTGQAKHQADGSARTTAGVRGAMGETFRNYPSGGVRVERNPFTTGSYEANAGSGGGGGGGAAGVGFESNSEDEGIAGRGFRVPPRPAAPNAGAGGGDERSAPLPGRVRRPSVRDFTDDEASMIYRLSKLPDKVGRETIKHQLGGMTGPKAKKLYLKMVLKYHPDKGGDVQVFKKLSNLFERAYPSIFGNDAQQED